jgi:hypothetical protein
MQVHVFQSADRRFLLNVVRRGVVDIFFSAKEINTLEKGTLGRPVNSRPARPPPRLHANGRGSDRPPSPAQRVERHRYFRRRPVAESVTVFFGLSFTRSNSPAIRPSSSPPSGARWLGGFLLLAPILFRFPLPASQRPARGKRVTRGKAPSAQSSPLRRASYCE